MSEIREPNREELLVTDDVVIPEDVSPEAVPEGWVSAWNTVSFQPARVGRATLTVDGVDHLDLPIVGWLVEEGVALDRASGRVAGLPVPIRRIVPGYLGSNGTVVALERVQVRGTDDAPVAGASWLVRIDGERDGEHIVVNVEPAPVHVEVLAEPKTRRVVRDKYGNIDKVVAE